MAREVLTEKMALGKDLKGVMEEVIGISGG